MEKCGDRPGLGGKSLMTSGSDVDHSSADPGQGTMGDVQVLLDE